MRALGRAALWSLVALLLLRGAGDVLAGGAPAPVVHASRAAAVSWPDDRARAFAVDFTRAYLSYSPTYPERYARGLLPFVSPDVADSIVPRFAQRRSRQVVQNAVVGGIARVDERRALVTVAATLVSHSVTTRYLTVPVARDARGGLTVDDLPSFAAPPEHGQLRSPDTSPLPGAARAEIEDVLTRFFRAFLAGRRGDLEYYVPAGVQIGALAQPYELAGLDSVAQEGAGAGRTRWVLATVRARDVETRAVYAMRYRVALVRRDRWYVAAVNATQKER
jgi:hypothetical protein